MGRRNRGARKRGKGNQASENSLDLPKGLDMNKLEQAQLDLIEEDIYLANMERTVSCVMRKLSMPSQLAKRDMSAKTQKRKRKRPSGENDNVSFEEPTVKAKQHARSEGHSGGKRIAGSLEYPQQRKHSFSHRAPSPPLGHQASNSNRSVRKSQKIESGIHSSEQINNHRNHSSHIHNSEKSSDSTCSESAGTYAFD